MERAKIPTVGSRFAAATIIPQYWGRSKRIEFGREGAPPLSDIRPTSPPQGEIRVGAIVFVLTIPDCFVKLHAAKRPTDCDKISIGVL